MKRLFVLLLALLTVSWGADALAAKRAPGRDLTVKLRVPPAAPPTVAQGRARFGIPGLDAVLERYGATDARPLFAPAPRRNPEAWRRLGMDRFYRIRFPEGTDADAAVRDLARESAVEAAGGNERTELLGQIGSGSGDPFGRPFDPNAASAHAEIGNIPELSATASQAATATVPEILPNDPEFDKQWHLRNIGIPPNNPTSPYPWLAGADIDASHGWNYTTGSPSIVVAIVDTDVKLDDPELASRLWVNPGEIAGNGIDDDENGQIDDVHGYDFFNGDGDPSLEPGTSRYYGGHGTWMASILGAETDNGAGVSGVDWSCRLMVVQAGEACTDPICWGIDNAAAASGIYYAVDNGADVINLSFGSTNKDAGVEVAVQYAISSGVLVIAAAGNNGTTDPGPDMSLYPAALDGVFAVGATAGNDWRLTWSNRGSYLDAVAPGVDLTAIGVFEVTGETFIAHGLGGTSFSAAIASGVAALLFAQDPSRTADQVAQLMRDTADDMVGRPEEDVFGFDIYHGWGRLNLYRALALGSGDAPPQIAAPAVVNGYEEQRIRFTINVTDPDGDAIESLIAWTDSQALGTTGLFNTSADLTEGTIEWWPDNGTAGDHHVWFQAENILKAVASTTIHVDDLGSPPYWTDIQVPTGITVREGYPIQIILSVSDPDGDPIAAWEVNPSDPPLPGGTLTTSPDLSTATFTWNTQVGDAGSYYTEIWAYSYSAIDPTVRLGNYAYGTLTVLPDQPPVVTAPSTASGQVGMALQVPVTAADPDGDALASLGAAPLPTGATFTAAPDFASGTLDWTPAAGQVGSHAVTFTAASMIPAGITGSATTTIAVADAPPADHPPVIAAPATYQFPLYVTSSFQVTATDPDADVIDAIAMGLVKGGPSFSSTGVGTPTATGTVTWTPSTLRSLNLTFTASSQCATGCVTGSAVTYVESIQPTNLPVVIDPIADVMVSEGASATVPVHASDPDGDPIVLSASLPSFGTLNAPTTGTGDVATTITLTPGFSDAGGYTATVSEAGGVSATFGITVLNADRGPVLTAPASASAAEGSLLTVDVEATDPDGDAVSSLSADLAGLPSGNDGAFSASGLGSATATGQMTWTPTLADAGGYLVGFAATAGGLAASAATAITVSNVNHAPIVSIDGPAPGSVYPVGTAIDFTGSFTDDPGDTHTAQWAFDGATQAGTVDEGAGTVTGSHTFTTAGVYRITLTVTDNYGATGTASMIGEFDALVVVYDPDAGFVTGGGWIDSPAGAYLAEPDLAGRAGFGFVSKYKKGANVPTGQTEFHFRVADLSFSSDTYEWLVVAGARAQYKGAGTINNAGAYGFILTATDGDLAGGDVDRFRIKIWDLNAGDAIVYDNQMGAVDDADPATALGGGSIVIHTGGKKAPMAKVAPGADGIALLQNYPNPFNPETTIGFVIAAEGRVRISIYDARGRAVVTLADGRYGAGEHEVRWLGRDAHGRGVPSGVYYATLEMAGRRESRAMVLLK